MNPFLVTYTYFGHGDVNCEAYILPEHGDDILIEPSDEFTTHGLLFNRDICLRADFVGRLDHTHKVVTVAGNNCRNDERLNYLISLLQMDYPGYTIWIFRGFNKVEKVIEPIRSLS